MSQAHQLGRRVFAKVLKKWGIEELNPAQGRILYVLWGEDGLSQAELARRTRLDKSGLALMIDRLEAAGQLRRARTGTDKREVRVWTTERNRALHSVYLKASQEMIDLTYKGFSDSEIDAFELFLRRIIENLEGSVLPETGIEPARAVRPKGF